VFTKELEHSVEDSGSKSGSKDRITNNSASGFDSEKQTPSRNVSFFSSLRIYVKQLQQLQNFMEYFPMDRPLKLVSDLNLVGCYCLGE
jgi:hypothetical protein